ncbi:hypothetical protein DCE93_05485 [Agromyces badenianii]|uniref:Uncharacterized protein n=1 Tax=Agromyces badenianii TaxID=2080742 RepID=A0A2S0WVB1_9MICO|nr:hypothetical protein [Agromyces badenianii]AWB95174.1 hypothetical protein DCE93_05485 [Agromyces badenianii]
MNTATLGGSTSRPAFPTGVAGLAVRAGLALERWGSRRAAARPTRDEILRTAAVRREAQQAVADYEATMRRTDLLPLR